MWFPILLACTRPGPPVAPLPARTGEDPADAAIAFLDRLTTEQRPLAALAFDSPRRADWSNLPTALVDPVRPGVRFGDLTQDQIDAALALVDTLSEAGAGIVRQIIAADNVLQSRDRDNLGFSTANYWVAVYGDPVEPPWGWGIGGHHLAVNVSTDGSTWTLSPTYLGVEPSSYELDGQTFAPLRPHADRAVELMRALPEEQQQAATIPGRPDEVIAGPGQDGRVPDIEGIDVGRLSVPHQALLLELIDLWPTMLPEPPAVDLAALHFAWNGPVDGSGPLYYRIQGARLLIEFSAAAVNAKEDAHVHSVFRTPENEYGSAWVK